MTVWVTMDSRHFAKRTVKIGLRQDDQVQILNGLKPGETVVTEGAVFLSNKLVLGDAGHIPFDPPVISRKIRIIVT